MLTGISMNQNPSHSQTPVFVKNESNTKPVLHQHPTVAEMQTPRFAYVRANAKDSLIAVAVATAGWLLISVILWILGG